MKVLYMYSTCTSNEVYTSTAETDMCRQQTTDNRQQPPKQTKNPKRLSLSKHIIQRHRKPPLPLTLPQPPIPPPQRPLTLLPPSNRRHLEPAQIPVGEQLAPQAAGRGDAPHKHRLAPETVSDFLALVLVLVRNLVCVCRCRGDRVGVARVGDVVAVGAV